MSRPHVERIWIGGGAAAAVLLAGVSWLTLVHPQLSKASSVRAQAADTRTQNAVLQSRINQLQAANNKIALTRKAVGEARAALPTDSGLAALSRQLTAQATAAHVTIASLSVGNPAPVTATSGPGAAATPAVGATSSATSAPTSTPAPAPAAPTSTNPAGQIFYIPITLTVAGPAANDLRFLHAVQTVGPRAVLITAAGLAGGGTNGAALPGGTTMTVEMQAFSAPQSDAAATPGTPAHTPTS